MRKYVSLFLLLFFAISFQSTAFAATIDLNSLDKVIIKVSEIDGSIKEVTINNDKDGQFEKTVKGWLEYYYNKYNIKEIISINDIPLKDTQFIEYSCLATKEKNGDPVQQEAQNNSSQSLDFSKSSYRISLDNVTYTDINVSPYTKNGIRYVEIKPILEAMGYNVTSVINGYYKVLSAQKKESYWIDILGKSKAAYIQDKGIINLDDFSDIKDSSICISVRSAEKLLGVSINVDVNTKQIKITTK